MNMTDTEFAAINPGARFARDGTEYLVVKRDGTHVVSHPKGNPRLLIHFLPSQAAQLTPIESTPDVRARPESSHGFPALGRAEPKLPAPHMSGQGQNGICMPIDGGLAEYRQGSEIGPPIPAALEFLVNAVKAGIDVQVSTHRARNSVWNWLRVHSPGMEHIVHVSPQPPPPGVTYVSKYAYRVGDTYPTVEQLFELIRHEEAAPTAMRSAF
jgi:hypothetical protein